MKVLSFISILLLIIGGLNWFLVGAFNTNLVSLLFGQMTLISRIVYILVGLSALFALLNFKKFM